MGGSKLQSNSLQAFQSWCLESSGKGRIEAGREHHVFDYYGTLEAKPGQYLVALDLPLYGEEIIELDLEQNKVSGNFLKRLKRTATLNNFLKSWREWILARKENRLPQSELSLDDEKLVLTTALTKNESVTLTLHSLTKEGYFARQTIAYSNNLTSESLKLELFTSECRIRAAH